MRMLWVSFCNVVDIDHLECKQRQGQAWRPAFELLFFARGAQLKHVSQKKDLGVFRYNEVAKQMQWCLPIHQILERRLYQLIAITHCDLGAYYQPWSAIRVHVSSKWCLQELKYILDTLSFVPPTMPNSHGTMHSNTPSSAYRSTKWPSSRNLWHIKISLWQRDWISYIKNKKIIGSGIYVFLI